MHTKNIIWGYTHDNQSPKLVGSGNWTNIEEKIMDAGPSVRYFDKLEKPLITLKNFGEDN